MIPPDDPRLYQKCDPVEPGEDVASIIEQLKSELYSTDISQYIGVGIAAPQIGIMKRVFLKVWKRQDGDEIEVYINPAITKKRDFSFKHTEGCLSFPDRWVEVTRYKLITLSYLDENMQQRRCKFSGFDAAVIQHEVDHLDGICIVAPGEY